MQQRFQQVFILAVIVFFASCKKTNTQGRYIPATAAIAIQVDGNSISTKLPWATIKDNPFFKQVYSDSTLPETFKKLLENPESTGIDIKKDLLFFVQKDSLGGYLVFEGSIKDAIAFKNFNTSFSEKGSASESDGISFISRMPVCIGWTKEKFVYVLDAPQLGHMDALSRRMIRDSIDISNHGKSRDIGATCKEIFALSESNSLGNNEKFTSLLSEPGDIHFWMNTEELSKSGNTSPAFSMVNLDKLTKENITTAAVTFDNGKIVINTLTYSEKDITALFKKYSGGKINEEMLKRIPGKDITAVMALNFKPEGIKEFLKIMNLDGVANVGLTSLGFGVDDFVKANKGDIVLGLTDLKMAVDTSAGISDDETNISINIPKPQFNFIFAASIGDKEAFNKMINAGKKLGGTFLNTPKVPFAYSTNETYFSIGNNQEQADKYLAGNNSNADYISAINGEPFGAYINMQAILKAFEKEAAKDSAAFTAYNASLMFWDNIMWKGGNFKNGGIAQHIEINLKEKSTSSLLQINQYAAKLSEARALQIKKQQEDIMAFEDAVVPVAAKDTVQTPGSGTKKK